MTYVAGSAVPTGWSPTSVEQAASTSASRVPGCSAAAAARSSASVIGAVHRHVIGVGPGGRLCGGPVTDPDDVRLSHGLDPSNVSVQFPKLV